MISPVHCHSISLFSAAWSRSHSLVLYKWLKVKCLAEKVSEIFEGIWPVYELSGTMSIRMSLNRGPLSCRSYSSQVFIPIHSHSVYYLVWLRCLVSHRIPLCFHPPFELAFYKCFKSHPFDLLSPYLIECIVLWLLTKLYDLHLSTQIYSIFVLF